MFVAVALFAVPALAWEDSCRPIHEIYQNGKELCENMWDDSFKYTTDEDKAYTMWFFNQASNPNKAVHTVLGHSPPNTCGLQYLHKDAPSPEGPGFNECLPWKDEACCHNGTVTSAAYLKEAYGKGYEWDRCGPMSPACERFFVQEACFYECDPHAGMYRKCSDAQVAAAANNESDPCHQNTWQMYKMPIRASYCDAWFESCRNDRFCGKNGGSYFGCNAHYWEEEAAKKLRAQTAAVEREKALQKAKEEAEANEGLAPGFVALIAILVASVFIACIAYIIRREKRGKPIFLSLVAAEEPHADNAAD